MISMATLSIFLKSWLIRKILNNCLRLSLPRPIAARNFTAPLTAAMIRLNRRGDSSSGNSNLLAGQARPAAIRQARPAAIRQARPAAIRQARPAAIRQARPAAIRQARPAAIRLSIALVFISLTHPKNFHLTGRPRRCGQINSYAAKMPAKGGKRLKAR